ncbi:MAG: hypothetical protein PHF87_00570 [Desulfotomaculaceae bacterium]|nr:hypothetical protein [Desulfotomaculaceae bacterium]
MFAGAGEFLLFEKLKRISIFTGYFGSGKTEIALNYAIKLKETGKKVTLVDLDLINPYFRVRQVKKDFKEKGIAVVSPPGKLAGADIPALPPSIHGVLEDPGVYGVFDVGGGDIGATVLGRFKNRLPDGAFNLFLVVNTCRPYSRDAKDIINITRLIEKSSRLNVSALVSNTNLGSETDASIILAGHRIILEAAASMDLPVAFISMRTDLASAMENTGVPLLPLTIFMKTPWQ